jgi:hypothetical protein
MGILKVAQDLTVRKHAALNKTAPRLRTRRDQRLHNTSMTWIRTVSPASDENIQRLVEKVRAGYPPEYATDVIPGESVTAAHSLIPDAMLHMMSGYAALLLPSLPLSRSQQEMIATVVSAVNRCFY